MKLPQLHPRLSLVVRFGGRLSLAFTQIFVIILFAWLALRLYPGDRWLLVRLGNYFAPWLFMALLPALVIALAGRRRWLTGLVLLLTLILGTSYIPLLTPRLSQAWAENNANELRVMTFNVHYANRNAQEIVDLIRAEKPDIIAIQELTPELAALVFPALESEYPHYLIDEGAAFNKALLSRYPLTAQSRSPETWCGLPALVETPAGLVMVWNVHPPPAVQQAGWEAQHRTLSALAKDIEAVDYPLIVLGDFNTTDQAENYRLVAGHLTDVQRAVGRGFGFTFPEPEVVSRISGIGRLFGKVSPVVRIDLILVSEHFIPQEIHVVPNGYGSDHRPVVATLRLVN